MNLPSVLKAAPALRPLAQRPAGLRLLVGARESREAAARGALP